MNKTINLKITIMETRKANGVEFYQDYDNSEGAVCMVSPKTIKRYRELKYDEPDMTKYGMFVAFSEKDFMREKLKLYRKGYLKGGEKLVSVGGGVYGTRAEVDRYFGYHKQNYERIAKECDPQEVYFYEWNNHECMISMDDDEPMKIVISIFGKETAHRIDRLWPCTPTNILAPLTERDRHLGQFDHQLMMLGRLQFDCRGFFSTGDCRHHRQDTLWGGNVQRQIEEMRKLYKQLPDDIKDASPMTEAEIEDYAKRLTEWADEEFGKAKYDPHPRTRKEDFPEAISLSDKLYYKDDDGMWQTPDHVWFSADLRRFKGDEREVHGRAMTSYLGKDGGRRLTEVYIMDFTSICSRPYRRDDLCDVSCKYDYVPGHGTLSHFYYE